MMGAETMAMREEAVAAMNAAWRAVFEASDELTRTHAELGQLIYLQVQEGREPRAHEDYVDAITGARARFDAACLERDLACAAARQLAEAQP
jgi:hypothetical protein